MSLQSLSGLKCNSYRGVATIKVTETTASVKLR